jgi:hypothetical protein
MGGVHKAEEGEKGRKEGDRSIGEKRNTRVIS